MSSTWKEDSGVCTHCNSPTESSVARVRINQYKCLSYSLRTRLTRCIVNVLLWGSGRAWFCIFNKVPWSSSFPQLQNLSWVKIIFRSSSRLRDKNHIKHVFYGRTLLKLKENVYSMVNFIKFLRDIISILAKLSLKRKAGTCKFDLGHRKALLGLGSGPACHKMLFLHLLIWLYSFSYLFYKYRKNLNKAL